MIVNSYGPQNPGVIWTPQDRGLITESILSDTATSGATLSPAGTLHTFKMHVLTPASVTNIVYSIVTAGNTLTSGQCFWALYQNGSLIGVTADQSGIWVTTGLKTAALVSGPFPLVAGDVIAAAWYNGTTGPSFRGGPGDAGAQNAGLATANLRFGKADTGKTTTAPPTLGAITGSSNVPAWIALS